LGISFVKIEIFKINYVSKLPSYYGNNSLQVFGKKIKDQNSKELPLSGLQEACVKQV
jgi:hypothetical protein